MALTVPFADANDLQDRWRPLSADEVARATVLLGDASQLILDEDRLDTLATLTDPASQTLVRIVCDVVKRAMQNPIDTAAVTSMQQTMGPFGLQATYSNPTGDLYLTKAERRALGFSTQRAGAVDMWLNADNATTT